MNNDFLRLLYKDDGSVRSPIETSILLLEAAVNKAEKENGLSSAVTIGRDIAELAKIEYSLLVEQQYRT